MAMPSRAATWSRTWSASVCPACRWTAIVFGPVLMKMQRRSCASSCALSSAYARHCAAVSSMPPSASAVSDCRLSRPAPPHLLGGPAALWQYQPLRWVSPQSSWGGAVGGAIPGQAVCARDGRVGHRTLACLIRLHVVPWCTKAAEPRYLGAPGCPGPCLLQQCDSRPCPPRPGARPVRLP